LRFKRQLGECEESDIEDFLPDSEKQGNRRIDEFGEVATRRITQVQKRFTPEEVALLVEKYLAGQSASELGREFGCNRITVSNVLKRNGIKIRGRGRQKGNITE